MENYEQIFDSHISQTFLNLLGGNEKDVIESGMGEESLVMATPRIRRVEPETETSAGAKNDKVADIKKILGSLCVVCISFTYLFVFGWLRKEQERESCLHIYTWLLGLLVAC